MVTSLSGHDAGGGGEERRELDGGGGAEVSADTDALENLGEGSEGLDVVVREARRRCVRRGEAAKADSGCDRGRRLEGAGDSRVGASRDGIGTQPAREHVDVRRLVSSDLGEATTGPVRHAGLLEVFLIELLESARVERAFEVLESLGEKFDVSMRRKDASRWTMDSAIRTRASWAMVTSSPSRPPRGAAVTLERTEATVTAATVNFIVNIVI